MRRLVPRLHHSIGHSYLAVPENEARRISLSLSIPKKPGGCIPRTDVVADRETTSSTCHAIPGCPLFVTWIASISSPILNTMEGLDRPSSANPFSGRG